MKRISRPIPLLQVSLVMSILASLSVCGLVLTRVKQKLTNLQENLAVQTTARQQTELDLAKTRTDLASSAIALKEARANLEAANLAKQKALSAAASQAAKSAEALAVARQQREEAQAELARYHAAGMEPEQIVSASQQIRSLEKGLAAARQDTERVTTKLQRLTSMHPEEADPMPADLKAKVVAADPKWHFIVLDAGEDRGVVEQGEILISRDGKLLARAKVSRVHKDHSIANIVPGWEFAEVAEGDSASPALSRF